MPLVDYHSRFHLKNWYLPFSQEHNVTEKRKIAFRRDKVSPKQVPTFFGKTDTLKQFRCLQEKSHLSCLFVLIGQAHFQTQVSLVTRKCLEN